MTEPPPPGNEMVGGLLCVGGFFVSALVLWLVSKHREREYQEPPEARSIREEVGPGSRYVVNQGSEWLTVAPDVLVLQPKQFGYTDATDLVIHRLWVRCIDFQLRDGDDVFNIYGLDGRLIVALASPHSSAVPERLCELGWPAGARLRWRPDPPIIDSGLRPPPPIRWASFFDTNDTHIG